MSAVVARSSVHAGRKEASAGEVELQSPTHRDVPAKYVSWKSQKLTVFLLILNEFMAQVSFSIVLPSIWNYLQKLGSTESMMGWAIAIDSVGAVISNIVVGRWLDQSSCTRVLFWTLLLSVIGNYMYASATGATAILIGRLLVGLASGNECVPQVYLADVIYPHERNLMLTTLSFAQWGAYVCGPILGALCARVDVQIGPWHLDSNTSPGYISAFASFCGILGLLVMTEHPRPSQRIVATGSEEPLKKK